MSNTKKFQLLPDEKYIRAMQQPESLLALSNPQEQGQEQEQEQEQGQGQEQEQEQGKIQRQEQGQEQEQGQGQGQEEENFKDGSIRKRKWECNDETSCVEILETPKNSEVKCYSQPRPPRKPKAIPALKGRAMWLKRSVVLLDVAKEVESMFPPSLLQDFGKKIKKARS